MKYNNFKIFKFSTISKKINRIKDSFSGVYKRIEDIPGNVVDIFGSIVKYIFAGIYKNIKFIINNFSKTYKSINFKKYSFTRIYERINILNFKNLIFYFFSFILLLGLVYLIIPMFFNYNKSDIEKVICKKQNIECSIEGKIRYSFLPYPRIIVKDLVIQDFFNKANTFARVNEAIIKISIVNLLETKKLNFRKIELKDFVIDFNLKNIAKYKNFSVKNSLFIPVSLERGQIKFFDDTNYVATIDDANLNLDIGKNFNKAILKGKFLGDNIYISMNNKEIDNNPSINIVLKMTNLNLLTKASLFTSIKDKETIDGKILIRKNKNKFTGFFAYKNSEVTFVKSNLRNAFLDGKLEGKIKFLPYFDFNLDLNLNNINFARLYSYLTTLNEENNKNLFRINSKINGRLNLSTNKIYSKYNLINSFESRIKFNNGDILIEQMLFNLGKLGAADVLGSINNDNKNSNFKFESNIYFDNQKKFFRKFGIYNKETIPSSLFVAGNFNLGSLRTTLYEISEDKKFDQEDLNYIEEEFNDLMLEDGYTSLFNFPKLKEFVKLMMNEPN